MTIPNNHTDQGRNSAMDKTDAYHPESDAFANQGGGKVASGNQGSGNPANDPMSRREVGKVESVEARNPQSDNLAQPGNSQQVKGSGNPPLSGAGKRADDRPGKDAPKSDHSSVTTHQDGSIEC